MYIKVTTADPIAWSNGDLFQGVVVLETVLPDGYTELNLKPKSLTRYMPRPLPKRYVLPIISGKLIQDFIMGAESLDPPNVRFKATWYDTTNRAIAEPDALFEITGDAPFELSVPVLTTPVAPTA